MKLTTKGRYAVVALLDIALHEDKCPISLTIIGKRNKISLQYLEQLFIKLRKNGLVKSYKGLGGGYALAKPASEISISKIILAVSDSIDARACLGKNNCLGETQCLAHDLWNYLTTYVHEHLDKISLYDVVDNYKKKHSTIQFYALKP